MTTLPQAPWQRRGRIERPLPLLGPPWAEALLGFSPAQLRAACAQRGLVAPPRASRHELAQRLTLDKFRAQAEQTYQDGQLPFPTHDLDYVPLPPAVKDLVRKQWTDQIKDSAGKAVAFK